MRDTPRSGIGPVLAAVIVAEIGGITRFRKPGQLGCWAGLTSRHRESDAKVTRGHISKQGPRILRWALCEAIWHQPADARPQQVKDGIIARRGQARNIAKTAAARELAHLDLLRHARRARPPRHQPGGMSLRPGRARPLRCLSPPALAPHPG